MIAPAVAMALDLERKALLRKRFMNTEVGRELPTLKEKHCRYLRGSR